MYAMLRDGKPYNPEWAEVAHAYGVRGKRINSADEFKGVFAEALASGLPALCTSVSDNSRYVIPGANGFTFDAGNSAYIAMALRRLSELTPEQRRSFGAESRRIAEENFSKDIFIERYLTLIRGISGGKTARP